MSSYDEDLLLEPFFCIVWTIQWSGNNTKYCHTDMRNIYICGSEGSPEIYDHKTAWETLHQKNAYWFPVWIYHFHMKPNMKSTPWRKPAEFFQRVNIWGFCSDKSVLIHLVLIKQQAITWINDDQALPLYKMQQGHKLMHSSLVMPFGKQNLRQYHLR